MDNFNIMNDMNKFILFLHKNIYIDNNLIKVLNDNIQRQFEVSSIVFTYDQMRFELKIKKTNIKREKNYSHTALFYYDKINAAFKDFFSDDNVRSIIEKNIEDIEDVFEYNTMKRIFEQIMKCSRDTNPIPLVYSVTPVLDNIIFINI